MPNIDLFRCHFVLDGVRRVDHLADVRRISEERGQIGPVSLPASAYLRVATSRGTSMLSHTVLKGSLRARQ